MKILAVDLSLKSCLALMVSLLFFLLACQKNDDSESCDSITCLNDGICLDGICQCTEMYTGNRCQFQNTPKRIVVNKIWLTNFPQKNGNFGWDIDGDPDVYLIFSKNGAELSNSAPEFYEDAINSQDYAFEIDNSRLNMTDVKDEYRIDVYDYDPNMLDDHLGGIDFVPYDSLNDFPSKILLEDARVKFELIVEYNF